jgi:hypothetical protein
MFGPIGGYFRPSCSTGRKCIKCSVCGIFAADQVNLPVFKGNNMGLQDILKKFAGWERMLYNYVESLELTDAESTVQFNNWIELNIRRIYSSPDAAAVKISFTSKRYPNAKYIVFKMKDEFYAAYPDNAPGKVNQYLLDALEYREREECDQKLYDYIASQELTADIESYIQDIYEPNARYIYSSQDAAAVEVSYKSTQWQPHVISKSILLRIKDEFYWVSLSAPPNHPFRYLFEILEFRERKAKK